MNAASINELLLNPDLRSKLELAKVFKRHFQARAGQDELRSIVIDYLMDSDADLRISNFDQVKFYGPGSGLSRYVANQLLLSLNVSSIKNRIWVIDQLNVSLNNLYDSKNPLLKTTKARSLIELLEQFLGDQFHRITNHRFLSIYFVPFENKQSNAAFDINTNSIAVFRTKEKQTQKPEYIFLHEFGHIVHSILFETTKEVPNSFFEFNKQMNPKFFEYSRKDQLEIYADLFSIAVMLDSEFEGHNPFIKTMKGVHTDKIREYCLTELSKVR